MTDTFISQKIDASAWFSSLRDDIVTRFEALEQTTCKLIFLLVSLRSAKPNAPLKMVQMLVVD